MPRPEAASPGLRDSPPAIHRGDLRTRAGEKTSRLVSLQSLKKCGELARSGETRSVAHVVFVGKDGTTGLNPIQETSQCRRDALRGVKRRDIVQTGRAYKSRRIARWIGQGD